MKFALVSIQLSPSPHATPDGATLYYVKFNPTNIVVDAFDEERAIALLKKQGHINPIIQLVRS